MADCRRIGRVRIARVRIPRIQIGQLQVGALGMAAIGVLVVAACSAPPERSILDQFFAAARLRDNTALRNLSTVTFEPLERGIVVDFEIASVATDRPDHKDVTITAPVELRDGQIIRKKLVVTLERGVLGGDSESARRWIVTAIRETA